MQMKTQSVSADTVKRKRELHFTKNNIFSCIYMRNDGNIISI